VHVPASLELYLSEKPHPPLVIVLHGGGGTGKGMIKLTGFNSVADNNEFIVCYPDGIDKHWGDGRDIVFRKKNGIAVDDVKFISMLIDTLIAKYNIDSSRVFCTGISNGGMMSFRLACALNNKIRAFAPVAISMSKSMSQNCTPGKHVPIMYIFGDEDPLVPFEGGQIMRSRGEVIPVKETVDFWLKNNEITDSAKITVTDNKDDDTYVQKYDFGKELVFYLVKGGGHCWPGGAQYLPKLIIGRTSQEFNASEEIWRFFSVL
jgi:polyhydroxybutyrate depolymerase